MVCETFGRLYSWSAAMGLDSSYNATSAAAYMGQTNQGICPDGWYVPDEGELNILVDYVDAHNGAEGVGTSLKSRYLWRAKDSADIIHSAGAIPGTDMFGLSLVPGDDNDDGHGNFAFDAGFVFGSWWLSTEISANSARKYGAALSGNGVTRGTHAKTRGESVRCLKNDENISFCGNTAYDPRISFCDARDNRIYKQVTIGTQTWMAENLDFGTRVNSTVNSKANNQGNATSESAQKYCYNDSTKYCDTYGGLYQWHTAMAFLQAYDSLPVVAGMIQSPHRGICPEGWHIPDSTEWTTLAEWVDNDNGGAANDAGRSLKTTTGWEEGGNGTDEYGFGGQPAGKRRVGGNYLIKGEWGIWLSATAMEAPLTFKMRLGYDHFSKDHDTEPYSHRADGHSIRCVKD